MANREDYLDALTAFDREGSKEIPPILEQYLSGVAKNGETLFQWPLLKPLLVGKMEQVIEEWRHGLGSENITSRPNVENVRFDVMRTRIMDAVHRFTGAPFTIQRLCELLIDPRRHYKRSDKFMRGLEKNVLVVSTVDPFGRKVVSESGNKHLVNGMDNGIPLFSRDSSISSSLPPVPGWVTTSASSTNRTPGVPEKTLSQESGIATNGVGSSLVNPMFGDQGDQTPAVHAEEVVETAVSVEPSEPGPEATGAGEAMAEDEEEEMGTEDTNASSSSSSSSSSEDLSSSDTGEGAAPAAATTPPPAIVTSSSLESPDVRPWAAIAAEAQNKDKEVSMELEPGSEPACPDTSKPSDSEHQGSHPAASQSPASASLSTPPAAGVDCPSPMDTAAASTSGPTAPPVDEEADKEAGGSPTRESEVAAPTTTTTTTSSQNGESPGFVPSMTAAVAEEDKNSEEDGQDISSSSSSSSSSSMSSSLSSEFTPGSASCSEAETACSYADTVDGHEPRSDSRQKDSSEDGEGESLAESSRSNTTVTSTEANSSPSESAEGKDGCSSSHWSQSETVDEGEPQAKYRRLSSEDTGSSSSSSSLPQATTQDSEPISSSAAVSDDREPSTDSPSPDTITTTTDMTPSNLSSEACSDAVTSVTTSHSPTVATDTTLKSTPEDVPSQGPGSTPETLEQARSSDLGGGDGPVSEPGVKDSDPDSQSVTTGDDNVDVAVAGESQDQAQPADSGTDSSICEAKSAENGTHDEPMEQD